MKRLISIFAAMALVCSCCQHTRLVILHINDTHSHLEPERSGRNAGRGGIIERAAFVDSVRAAEGESKVLLLHAGDIWQGSSYFSEFGGTLEVDMVNAMRYDCIALGNHEFDNGLEILAERMSKVECPVVCANLDLSPFELGKYVKPYAILERGGMSIGIIGLAPDLSYNVSKSISSRIPQLDPVESINKYAAELKSKGCDLVILLSHQGYPEDQENAARCRNVDLIISGHSHTFVDGFIYVEDLDHKKVPITSDGCYGLEMGEIRL